MQPALPRGLSARTGAAAYAAKPSRRRRRPAS